jgi:threonine dehydrogenase-like Zn-dependent dehydrogenase
MKALYWNGVDDLRVQTFPDPGIVHPTDAIVRVRLSSVCGSDLHLVNGYVPTMKPGDILGHEFLGEVVETGPGVRNVSRGDRVIVISIIACGACEPCRRGDFSCCDNSNPKPGYTRAAYGCACAGIFGYSHAFGGYPGSHAEYIRVPYADVNAFRVPDGVPDDKAVFVSDAVPTGFTGADNADIQPGDTVAVWGCGGVGLMAIQSAFALGAGQVIAIDRLPERLALARRYGAETIDYETTRVHEALMDITAGRGPDRVIEAVGMEAHGYGPHYWYDRAKQALRLHTERGVALRQAIRGVRKGGTVSVLGVFGGIMDSFPMGAIVNKALTLRAAQQPGQRYVERLFDLVQEGRIDPAPLLTHRARLEDGQRAYAMFRSKSDGCVRVVFAPGDTMPSGA